jgi:hypothetical protein
MQVSCSDYCNNLFLPRRCAIAAVRDLLRSFYDPSSFSLLSTKKHTTKYLETDFLRKIFEIFYSHFVPGVMHTHSHNRSY